MQSFQEVGLNNYQVYKIKVIKIVSILNIDLFWHFKQNMKMHLECLWNIILIFVLI